MSDLITVFKNRIPWESYEGAHGVTVELPLREQLRPLLVAPQSSIQYKNLDEWDFYAPYSEITFKVNRKKPCGFEAEMELRKNFAPRPRGFSILLVAETANYTEGVRIGGETFRIPACGIPITIYALDIMSYEMVWSEIHVGMPEGKSHIKRCPEEIEKIESLRRERILHPLSFRKS